MQICQSSNTGEAEAHRPNVVHLFSNRGHRRVRKQARLEALCLCLNLIWLITSVATPLRAAETAGKTPTKLERLKAGGTLFTNVTIVEVTATHLFIKSSQGIANVRLDDLEPDVKALFVHEDQTSTTRRESRNSGSSASLRETTRTASARESSPGLSKLPGQFVGAIHGWTGALAILTGFCMVVGGWLWLVGVAFRAHVGWGLGVLFGSLTFGLINLLFIVTHWEESRRPFWLYVGGMLVILLGVLVPKH